MSFSDLIDFLQQRKSGTFTFYAKDYEKRQELSLLAQIYGANVWGSFDKEQPANETTVYRCRKCGQGHDDSWMEYQNTCVYCDRPLSLDTCETLIVPQNNQINFTFETSYPKSPI